MLTSKRAFRSMSKNLALDWLGMGEGDALQRSWGTHQSVARDAVIFFNVAE